VFGLAPAHDADVAGDGRFSWAGGDGADSFTVYLSPAGSGCDDLFGTTRLHQLEFTSLAPGDYDWRVVANKAGCPTPPQSDCIRFTIVNPCLSSTPVLLNPSPDASSTSPITFEWQPVAGAVGYTLVIESAEGTQEIPVTQPGAPLPASISVAADVPPGPASWRVVADFPGQCPSIGSLPRALTVVPACPTAVAEPIAPVESSVIDATPVEFQWTSVEGAAEYEVFISVNGGAFTSAGTVAGSVASPSLAAPVPAGAALAWYVETRFAGDCDATLSRIVDVDVSCFPPVLSLQGEVTTEKPYQVRATIVSEGLGYLFQEAADEDFTSILAQKEGEVESEGGNSYVFAVFEHQVTEPTAFYYRVKLDQEGCAFSEVGRIVVLPLPPPTATEIETVVQFGNEEPIVQDLFVASPTPDADVSYSFTAETDRPWMTVSPPAGTIGPAGITLTVFVDPIGLDVGTNTGTVVVTFTDLASGKGGLETTPITSSRPVSTTLVTPVTNTGKNEPQPDSLIVPAVAHATGVNSDWQTDLRLLNLGTEKQKYALNLTLSGQDGTQTGKTSELELNPGQNAALNDVVKQWYGVGSLPGESGTGVLEIRPLNKGQLGAQAVPVTQSLVSLASSRTYNKTPQGTLGEYVPALPFGSFIGGTPAEGEPKSVLSLQQLAQNSAYRSNLGLVEASGNPVNVEIRFYDDEGVSILTLPVSLQAGEHRQLNQVLAMNGLTDVPSARAEIEVVSGEGKISAYASVVDNVTGDPLQVQAVDLSKVGASKYVLPGIAHLDTGQARWRTDVQVLNAGDAAATATIAFFPGGASVPSQTVNVTIEPGKIQTLDNIIPNLFGQSNVGGAIQVTTATDSQLVITGRTYDQREEGSYGQFMSAVTEDEAIGLGDRGVQILQMEQSSNIRSNLGIVEVTGKAVRVELSAFPAESRVTPRVEVTLQPNEFRQFNQVLKSLNAGTTYNARVSLRVVGGDGKIVAYGSAVDNLTQDPTYIPGQ
jgi:hypothetical protein